MKKLAKTFIILGIIFRFYLIFPLVIGIIAVKRINKPTNKNDMIVWIILTFLFTSIAGAVLMYNSFHEFICGDKNLVKDDSCETNDIKTIMKHRKLIKLKEMYDNKIIDLDTYEKGRKKLVKEL